MLTGFLVLAEGLDMFRLGATASDMKMNLPCNLCLTKMTVFGWMSES
jgi:hypothetical protein